MIGRRLPAAWRPLLAAVLVCGVLLSATAYIHVHVQQASKLVTRGLGEAFSIAARETLTGTSVWPPTQAQLDAFLQAHAEEGLRYVGLAEAPGRIVLSAGQPLGSGESRELTFVGDRARVMSRLGPRMNRSPGDPPPTANEMFLRRVRLMGMVFEFEPIAAQELEGGAQRLFVVTALSCLAVLALAVGLSRSLSQRERMRGELEHGRRLAALGTMSAVLAHELRNPLASLKGHAQLLEESVEADPKLNAKARKVVGEAVRLERLTNNLLTYVQTGGLQRTAVDPDAVLRAAAEAVREPSAPPVDLRLSGGVARIDADAERLQQALENVLRNAVQATADGQAVEAEVRVERDDVRFVIRDHGAGIAAGEEEKIFEPFVTGRVKGVGLGLAITRQILEQHGGKVSARNADGGGAQFELRVPRAKD